MTKQAKPALAEGGVHSGKTSTSQHFFVGILMLPINAKHTPGGIIGGRFFLLRS